MATIIEVVRKHYSIVSVLSNKVYSVTWRKELSTRFLMHELTNAMVGNCCCDWRESTDNFCSLELQATDCCGIIRI